MDKTIEDARERLQKARDNLVAIAREVQRECSHHVVTEKPWHSFPSGGCMNGRRICENCGFEEEGSHWSGRNVWSRVKFDGPAQLDNERIVHEAKDDRDFYRFRISGMPVNSAVPEQAA